ncbi:MAG: hybrid sensor histidine kinase/response regulator [Alphaproteobacteria bacterium]|nr:MAG: hybrid sensor histidine kinase/response regulator [Alphaproteobacteria bacterium]
MIDILLFDSGAKKIINAVTALIIVLDEKGRIIFFNHACELLTGYDFQEVAGRYVWDFLLHPDEIEATKKIFFNLALQKISNTNTNYWVNKQGDSHLISWSNTVIRSAETNELYVVGTGVDISKHSAMADLLSEREAKFKAIFESANDGIIITDRNGKIEQVNFTATKLFGYNLSELHGKNVKILIPEQDHDRHDEYIQKYNKTGQKNILDTGREVIGLRKDKSVFPLYLSLTEVTYDDSGGFVAMIHDLTERNKYLEEIHQAQKMEALGQLTGGLAHDFNNLLTVILGDLEMLHNSVSSREGKELLDDAIMNVDFGAQLIERLLAFGRRQSLSPKIININRLSSVMYNMLRRTIGEDIDIEENFTERIWPVCADPGLVENAILNLVFNARDALPEGGRIILKTENYIADPVKKAVPDLAEGPYVKFSVCDNGTGMSPQVLKRICEPFFTTKAAGSGTGLGLSMVYGFVKQSGGNIHISSELGKGTIVAIYLPKAEDIPAEKNGSAEIKESVMRGQGETILYVEDDPKVRRVNARRLMELGYVVHTAKDGPSALAILEKQGQVDLLFTDIVMPGGMSGKELADFVRKQQPDIKVSLTTGYAEQITSGELGGDNLLKKPYSKQTLARHLQKILDD